MQQSNTSSLSTASVCLTILNSKFHSIQSCRLLNMPRLRIDQRNVVLGMLCCNASIAHIERTFNHTRCTIYKFIGRQNATGRVQDRTRTGQPRKITAAQDRYIRTLHLRDRFRTAALTSRQFRGASMSRQTVDRRLKAFWIVCRRPAKRCQLLPHHMQARLRWCRLHRKMTMRQWNRVIFSDESRFLIAPHGGRSRIYRRRNEHYFPQCISEASDKRSVMVWGAISSTGRSKLVIVNGNLIAQRYINDILQPHLVPFANQRHGLVFQHDNAPTHRVNVTLNFLNQNNLQFMNRWPALSPDLNPIEQLWNRFGRDVKALHPPPRTVQQHK